MEAANPQVRAWSRNCGETARYLRRALWFNASISACNGSSALSAAAGRSAGCFSTAFGRKEGFLPSVRQLLSKAHLFKASVSAWNSAILVKACCPLALALLNSDKVHRPASSAGPLAPLTAGASAAFAGSSSAAEGASAGAKKEPSNSHLQANTPPGTSRWRGGPVFHFLGLADTLRAWPRTSPDLFAPTGCGAVGGEVRGAGVVSRELAQGRRALGTPSWVGIPSWFLDDPKDDQSSVAVGSCLGLVPCLAFRIGIACSSRMDS